VICCPRLGQCRGKPLACNGVHKGIDGLDAFDVRRHDLYGRHPTAAQKRDHLRRGERHE
jgi:hypothetical protein